MAKSSDIWISLWNGDPDRYILPIRYDNTGREPKLGEKCRKAIPLESEDVPEHPFHSGQRRLRPPLKEAHRIANGVPIVRRDLKELLERFDLGKMRFFPREILKADRKTMLSDEFFVVSLAGTKDLAVIEGSAVRVLQSPRMVLLTYAERFLVRREDPPTTDMRVDAAYQYKGVFFSDRLRQAIKDAGFKKLSFKKTKAPPG